MKKILLFATISLLFGCESVKEDARETPIGSVLSGKTTDMDSYLEQVKQKNQNSTYDNWAPRSNERF